VFFVITFIIGMSAGKFLNFIAGRTLKGESFTRLRASSSSCKRHLSKIKWIPILSHFLIKCDCVKCADQTLIRVLLVEIVSGLLFVATYIQHGFGAEFIILSAAISLLLLIAIIDLKYGLIPDHILFPAIIVLLFLSPFWTVLGLDRPLMGNYGALFSLANSLCSGAGAFLAFLAVSLLYPQGIGGGDVKMAGLLGLLLGFPYIILALWISVFVGGSIASWLLLSGRRERGDTIPFGPCLSLGALTTLLAGDYLVSVYENLIMLASRT